MELQVTLTLSDRLFVLLEDKLPNLGRRIEKAVTKELGAQTRRESSIAVSVSTGAQPSESAEIAAGPTTAEAVPENTRPEAATEPAPQTPVQQSGKTNGEIIREIMHRTRQRFEGEDYKENANSDTYKKYHKPLTSMFKQIAAVLGADKPSALPPEKIDAFAAECDALIIGEDGNITPPSTLLNS